MRYLAGAFLFAFDHKVGNSDSGTKVIADAVARVRQLDPKVRRQDSISS
jgi:hypothetical protein